jgi:hypothetical protein
LIHQAQGKAPHADIAVTCQGDGAHLTMLLLLPACPPARCEGLYNHKTVQSCDSGEIQDHQGTASAPGAPFRLRARALLLRRRSQGCIGQYCTCLLSVFQREICFESCLELGTLF